MFWQIGVNFFPQNKLTYSGHPLTRGKENKYKEKTRNSFNMPILYWDYTQNMQKLQ